MIPPFLAAISPRAWLEICMAMVIVALLGVAGVQAVRLADEEAAHAKTTADYNAEVAKAERAARAADARERAIENRFQQEKDDAIAQAREDLQAAVADARRAAAVGVRDAARSYATRSGQACPTATAATGSAPAEEDGFVLANLLGEAYELARHYAEQADAARIAGSACERIYDRARAAQMNLSKESSVEASPAEGQRQLAHLPP